MNTLSLVITGQIRGGKNNICVTRTGHRFPNKQWATWRDAAVREIKSQLPEGFTTIDQRVSVTLDYYAGDNRRRDFPAICDSVWHVLEKAGVVSDDTLLWPTKSSRGFAKDHPRCEITIQVAAEANTIFQSVADYGQPRCGLHCSSKWKKANREPIQPNEKAQ